MANPVSYGMSENSKFNFLIFVFAGLAVLGYASYFVWSEMTFAERFYIEKKGELISLEKKQEQIAQLQEELKKISENRIEVIDSLIIKDDVLKVIERIEAVAKRERLLYEVVILGEVTKESIERELADARRARRGGREERLKEIENKFPNISFQITLTGGYSGMIRFFEGIGTLPHYTKVERFDLLDKTIEGTEEEPERVIKGTISLTIFTRE